MKETKRYNTILITPGACGTFMLADIVGIRILNNGAESYKRHRRDPNITNADHMIYMYSNPYDTILSYHRRGFINNPEINPHCLNMDGDVNYLLKNKNLSLEKFLSLDKDPFMIEDHFFKYYNYNERKYNIMFVKYESLEKNINKVLEWLNSSDKIGKFNFKKRNSEWKRQPIKIKELLNDKFGKHKEFLDSIPDIIIKNKQ